MRIRLTMTRLGPLEWLLLLVGLAALDLFIWINASSALYQAYQDWAFDQKLRGLAPAVPGFVADEISWLFGTSREAREIPAAPSAEAGRPAREARTGSILGRLEIPRLNMSAMVREGADEGTLRMAVGHIPGTALPGRPGNVALAGHRDTFFRQLRWIQKNDEIEVETERGTYRYAVESTKVVRPRDTSVLAASGGETLTLVTCFPFRYVGSAPERFIVRAREVVSSASRLHQRQPGS